MDPEIEGTATPPSPSRRAVIGAGLATAALAWTAPAIVSVPAASAATLAPLIVIDPFTTAGSSIGDIPSTSPIEPIGGSAVVRTLHASGATTEITVGGGSAALYIPTGALVTLDYAFTAPLDLSGCTMLTATSAVTGAAQVRLFIDFVGGASFIVDATTTTPELVLDLSTFTPVQLAGVTSMTLRIGATVGATGTLGPLTAS